MVSVVKEKVEDPDAVVNEAEGYKLFLSAKTATGYMGVFKQSSGRFIARRMAGGKDVCIGTFDTAVEAAVAFAKHAAKDGVYPDENLGVAPPWLAAALEQAKDGSVVEEAGATNCSSPIRIRPATWACTRVAAGSKRCEALAASRFHIGTYDTAVEAAVAQSMRRGARGRAWCL